MCDQCQCFRPIEMYKNLLHKPEDVTDYELNQLEQRRKKEKQLILDKDVVEEDGDDNEASDEYAEEDDKQD